MTPERLINSLARQRFRFGRGELHFIFVAGMEPERGDGVETGSVIQGATPKAMESIASAKLARIRGVQSHD